MLLAFYCVDYTNTVTNTKISVLGYGAIYRPLEEREESSARKG